MPRMIAEGESLKLTFIYCNNIYHMKIQSYLLSTQANNLSFREALMNTIIMSVRLRFLSIVSNGIKGATMRQTNKHLLQHRRLSSLPRSVAVLNASFCTTMKHAFVRSFLCSTLRPLTCMCR